MSIVQLLQANMAEYMRYNKVLINSQNSLSKNAIFVIPYGGT